MVLAVQTMEKIIETYYHPAEHRVDIIGYNSLYPRDLSEGFPGGAEPLELRMRVAVRDAEKEIPHCAMRDLCSNLWQMELLSEKLGKKPDRVCTSGRSLIWKIFVIACNARFSPR